jgi:hypothetical protein
MHSSAAREADAAHADTGLLSSAIVGRFHRSRYTWRSLLMIWRVEADREKRRMNSAHGERKACSIFTFRLFLCFIASNVFAQSGGPPPETIYRIDWNERLNPNVGLKAHDDGLLDDKIDFSTGRLSFETVDVSLPGNSALPVEIRRRRNPSQANYNEFADWQLAVPSISTKITWTDVAKGFRWGKTRCSASLVSSIPNSTFTPGGAPVIPGQQPVLPKHYSDGVLLDVPGASSSHLLDMEFPRPDTEFRCDDEL